MHDPLPTAQLTLFQRLSWGPLAAELSSQCQAANGLLVVWQLSDYLHFFFSGKRFKKAAVTEISSSAHLHRIMAVSITRPWKSTDVIAEENRVCCILCIWNQFLNSLWEVAGDLTSRRNYHSSTELLEATAKTVCLLNSAVLLLIIQLSAFSCDSAACLPSDVRWHFWSEAKIVISPSGFGEPRPNWDRETPQRQNGV